jgi:hypothetical protein
MELRYNGTSSGRFFPDSQHQLSCHLDLEWTLGQNVEHHFYHYLDYRYRVEQHDSG